MINVKKLLFGLLPLLAGCSGIEVHTDYDPTVDFSRYKTYEWIKKPVTPDPLNSERIVDAIDNQLFAKGWRKAAAGQGEAAVAAHVTAREQERYDTMYNSMGPGWVGPGLGGVWAGTGVATTTVTYKTIGTLIVDIFDAKSKKGLWHGTAEGTVSQDPQANLKEIREATSKMFMNFPVSGIYNSGPPMR